MDVDGNSKDKGNNDGEVDLANHDEANLSFFEERLSANSIPSAIVHVFDTGCSIRDRMAEGRGFGDDWGILNVGRLPRRQCRMHRTGVKAPVNFRQHCGWRLLPEKDGQLFQTTTSYLPLVANRTNLYQCKATSALNFIQQLVWTLPDSQFTSKGSCISLLFGLKRFIQCALLEEM
jgi:hypothetical protein